MNIKPTIKTFHVLPFISVRKYKNPLSEDAQITFDYDWKDFYSIEIGWLFWSVEF